MKQLFLFASMMLSVTLYSQWEVGDYVDENDNETGDIFLYQDAVGKFSRGRKKNKPCSYFLEHDILDKTFAITIYPYKKSEAVAWKYETFQWTIIKTPSGKVSPIEAFCIDGMIYFEGVEYEQFISTIKEEGMYTMTMTHLNNDVYSKYKLTFNN